MWCHQFKTLGLRMIQKMFWKSEGVRKRAGWGVHWQKKRGLMVRSALPHCASGSACGGSVRLFLREEGIFCVNRERRGEKRREKNRLFLAVAHWLAGHKAFSIPLTPPPPWNLLPVVFLFLSSLSFFFKHFLYYCSSWRLTCKLLLSRLKADCLNDWGSLRK